MSFTSPPASQFPPYPQMPPPPKRRRQSPMPRVQQPNPWPQQAESPLNQPSAQPNPHQAADWMLRQQLAATPASHPYAQKPDRPQPRQRRRARRLNNLIYVGLLIALASLLFYYYGNALRSQPVEKGLLKPQRLDTLDPDTSGDGGLDLAGLLQAYPGLRLNDHLILVNRDHPLPADFKPRLEQYRQTGFEMNPALIEPLDQLAQKVLEETGDQLRLESTYRDRTSQEETYLLMPDVAQKPGSSEHETGLAIDLSIHEHAGLIFPDAPGGALTQEICWDYGFIIRYLKGEEAVTGVTYEPWHLRYVGLPHSQILQKTQWTLEAYIEHLVPDNVYAVGPYRIVRQKGPDFRLPEGFTEGTVSPDNLGGYIFTLTQPQQAS